MSANPFLARIERQGVLRGVHKVILGVLEDRFGTVPEELREQVRRITDEERLRVLRRNAALCGSLQAFQEQMDLAPVSTGG